jgi:general secretion pathway protein G
MFKAMIDSRRNEEGGFTLIELLIVIIIIGILAAVVIFAVGGIREDSQEKACSADARTVKTAQEAHLTDTGAYAANVDALVTAGLLESASTMTSTNNTGAVTGIGVCA